MSLDELIEHAEIIINCQCCFTRRLFIKSFLPTKKDTIEAINYCIYNAKLEGWTNYAIAQAVAPLFMVSESTVYRMARLITVPDVIRTPIRKVEYELVVTSNFIDQYSELENVPSNAIQFNDND